MSKIVICLLGSLSVGKTSQNKLLIQNLGDGEREYVNGCEGGINYFFTKYGNLASLGKINEAQCTGLDNVYQELRNEGVELSLKKAREVCDIVIIESILFSSVWFEFIKRIEPDYFLIHLKVSFEENVRRLKWRKYTNSRQKEDARDINKPEDRYLIEQQLTDANYEFIRKTKMQYENIFNKVKNERSLEIDCTDTSKEEVNQQIINFIYSKL